MPSSQQRSESLGSAKTGLKTENGDWNDALRSQRRTPRIVGGEFYKERQRLTEEAERVRKVAQDELLHRLRNITGPKGGP
jgi:hypothetical protein